MRKAVIDLGTNTFNLLIAEVENDSLSILHKSKEAVLLGMGGINDGLLADDAITRALETLGRFLGICDDYSISRNDISGIGTSALRAAANAHTLIDEVKNRYNFSIDIVSGQKEAQFIYQGVKWAYDFAAPAVILDIGGGSSEFILANSSGIQSMVSFEIGVSRIFQHLDKPKKYSSEQIQSIVTFMSEKEDGQLHGFSSDTMIGSSGSFETFYEMIHEHKYEPSSEVVELNISELQNQLEWAIHSTLEDRMNHPWIIPMRKRMLPIAATQIKWAINKLGIKKVLLSPYSLKEGVMR